MTIKLLSLARRSRFVSSVLSLLCFFRDKIGHPHLARLFYVQNYLQPPSSLQQILSQHTQRFAVDVLTSSVFLHDGKLTYRCDDAYTCVGPWEHMVEDAIYREVPKYAGCTADSRAGERAGPRIRCSRLRATVHVPTIRMELRTALRVILGVPFTFRLHDFWSYAS